MANRTPRSSPQLIDEALTWFIGFNENTVDAAGRDEFNAWLRRSPEHVRVYLQISALWEDADIFKRRPDLDIDALMVRAEKERNVFPLELRPRADTDSAQSPARVPSPAPLQNAEIRASKPSLLRRPAFALAAAVVLLSVGALTIWGSLYRGTYATGIGEQRSIALEDGSSLDLNSRSRVRVHFTERERSIELLEGQALFRVAKVPGRPFRVRAGQTVVRAVGTAFDVYKKNTGTVVTVVEGRVAITRDGSGNRPKMSLDSTYLSAGEQLIVATAATAYDRAKPKLADVSKATAWTQKTLVFEFTPLQEVVEEFNRYNSQQLVIRDPELYDFHVSGVFPSTDSSRMIEFLRQRFGVQVNPSAGEVEISKPR